MADSSTTGSIAPTDTVGSSRWWYWIAAYPMGFVVGLPLIVFLVLLAVIPIGILGIDDGQLPSVVAILALFAFGLIVFALLLALFVIFLLLPIALYFDASNIRDAPVEWSPDPLVYALIAALQFIVTPIIGLVVALYYLYRRHTEIGTP